MSTRILSQPATAMLLLSWAALAAAQPSGGKPRDDAAPAFPVKSVRIIVGNSPGGANDIIARLVGQRLNDAWGQSVIVDNRAGGSGVIAMEIAARAAPDGHTLLVSNSQMATNMLLGKVAFDIRKAYAPVVGLTIQGYVVAVNPGLPAGSVKELIAYSKSKPGGLSYGSPGTGSPAHLGIELFRVMTGADLVHVPYKGNGPAMIDLMSGQIQLVFGSSPSVMPLAKSGKLKALAVTTPKRAQGIDLPTVAEAGVPGYELVNGYGFLAPAGTPAGIVAAINRASNEVLRGREFKARLDADGVEAVPPPNTPAEYRDSVNREIARLEQFFRTPGVSRDAFR